MSNFDNFLSSLSDEQKQKLVEALMGGEKEPKQAEKPKRTPSTEKSVTVDENFFVSKADTTQKRRREPVRGRENRWQDEGEDRDIETPHFERTPRGRDAPKKVDLECSVCGRTFKEDSRYVYGEFPRCNRCTGK
jgi:hypothetical protein